MSVTVYYKENSGIKTPQNEDCKFFVIDEAGAKINKPKAFGEILFYEKREHADNELEPNASRRVEWTRENEASIPAGIERILSFENKETTSGDIITLKGAIKL